MDTTKRLMILACALASFAAAPGVLAVESASQARERRAKEVVDMANAGNTALKDGNFDLAIEKFSGALDRGISGDNKAVALYGRGLAYFQKKDCPNAMKDFDQIVEQRATDAQFHFVRALCLVQAGDKPGAYASVDKAIAIAPEKPEYYRFKCIDRFNAKDFTGALPDCEKTVSLTPDDADIWLAIGQSAELTNDKVKARGAYEKLLALKPDSQGAKDGLARTAK
ncbi:MAG TPA: hypothetical protein DCL54_08110 [Alphaproteobacteria bacterium]|nr:hypothetical protein [Alphaproteobacteria bacterium]HAJ46529.1 hypothetical protein [Alphaproteobacteria bacterium]